MIVILKPGASDREVQELISKIEAKGVNVSRSEVKEFIVLRLMGDTGQFTKSDIEKYNIVYKVVSVQKPYKKANRMFHPDDTVIRVGTQRIGDGHFCVIAGPCSVESEEQIIKIAKSVKKSGANFLRGGAFKPRTSPYSFQGLELEGLRLLKIAKQETGLPIVSELMSIKYLNEFLESVDIIQIGARNMQNFDLLKEVGKVNKPILLKRGLSSTIEEWLMSAEYIMMEGNENVILCERGIRTFESATRNTLDIQSVPVVQKLSHLPIIVDPSHAAGDSYLVPSMSKAAVVAGSNGLMIEVHNDPENAWSDGKQCLNLDEFNELMKMVRELVKLESKRIDEI